MHRIGGHGWIAQGFYQGDSHNSALDGVKWFDQAGRLILQGMVFDVL